MLVCFDRKGGCYCYLSQSLMSLSEDILVSNGLRITSRNVEKMENRQSILIILIIEALSRTPRPLRSWFWRLGAKSCFRVRSGNQSSTFVQEEQFERDSLFLLTSRAKPSKASRCTRRATSKTSARCRSLAKT